MTQFEVKLDAILEQLQVLNENRIAHMPGNRNQKQNIIEMLPLKEEHDLWNLEEIVKDESNRATLVCISTYMSFLNNNLKFFIFNAEICKIHYH